MALESLLLFVVAGLAAGLLSGLFGLGGGVVAVPAAVIIGGLSFHEAKAASLAVLILGGGSAAWRHARFGHVRARLGLVLGLGGAVGAAVASRMSEGISGDFLAGAFGVLLIVTAVRLWFPTPQRPDHEFPLGIALVVGLAGGALAGFFGVGGGIIMVPALALLGVPMHEAVGTSLVAVLINGTVAAVTQTTLGYGEIILTAGGPMAVAALASSWAGAWLARVLHADRLRRWFAAFMALLSIRFLAPLL